ncbi:hypothetical protein ACFU6S_03540 [Streptomyces sp. NPDC057456]|uniref:hypothetical protein n=1 Tax=Streptomyces sp. NPDC057456 TaxID=3346139 RepID=UPI003674A1FB
MNTRAAACATLLALAALTGCSDTDSDSGDVAACKTAMAKQLEEAVTARSSGTPMPTGTRPAACAGVDDATLTRLTGEVTTEWANSDQADKVAEDALKSATPAAVPTGPEISADCRAWIERELLDSSESLDATAGSSACGDMSDAELDAAIEAVTNVLVDQDATPAP